MSKILVAYGTRHGSAREIAEHIGETLTKEGHEVDVKRATKSVAVDDYDLVVIGSGIQVGSWTKEAKNFLRLNSSALKWKKTAIYVSCGDVLEEEKREESYKLYLLDPAEKNGLQPVSYGFFGGTFDFTGNKGFMYNMFMKMIKGDFEKKGIPTEGVYDFRDWEAITEWTENLPTAIQ
jgi:menaquinone-dependent protoporphyrinogen IX oxidase